MHTCLVKLRLAQSPVPPTLYRCPKAADLYFHLEESRVGQQLQRFSAGFKMCERAAVTSPLFKY